MVKCIRKLNDGRTFAFSRQCPKGITVLALYLATSTRYRPTDWAVPAGTQQ
jgi:hypothetical protein